MVAESKVGKLLGLLLVLSVVCQICTSRKAVVVDTSQCASRKMDLVVIMDGTISMGYEPFDNQRDFVMSILARMNYGPQVTQLSIIQFSDRWNTAVEMEMGLHGGKDEVLYNVSNIVYQQGTRTKTGLAMYLAYEQFFGGKGKARPGVDKVLLLITDGKPADMELLKTVVKDLKQKHVRIITVAIGTSFNYIQRFRYVLRSIASGFDQAFKATKDDMYVIVNDVAKEICKTIQTPFPSKGKPKLQQRCFQEKKDILFALDGSAKVDTETFNKAKAAVAQICAELDITPSLIHVGLLQYSDKLNTRVEFRLGQYDRYYQINQSLENVFHSKGSRADVEVALSIVDNEIFNGKNGDRISAEDYLMLFLNEAVKETDQIFERIQKLKDKGVHVIIVGLGKPHNGLDNFYEKLASHPNDVNYLDEVILKNVVGDLTAIYCRKVSCETEKIKENTKDKRASEEKSPCQQKSQDVLLMIDTTESMIKHFKKALKFFTKFVKRLSIAATKTSVGLITFGRYHRHFNMEFDKYKFESDINRKIMRTRQTDKWYSRADVAGALHMVNKQIFNTSTGGHRKDSPDLIFMATCGMVVNRYKIQRQAAILRAKGVRIAVVNVCFKNKDKESVARLNAIRDMVSGARDIYPLDIRRISTISQSLLEVQCKYEEQTVSPQCFARPRKVFFVLDSSRGLGYRELPTVINFIQEIVRRLYTKPNNIEIGLMHYSDLKTARFALQLKKRSLQDALDGINNIAYRIGKKNFLGHALKTVRKRVFRKSSLVSNNEERIIIILAHSEPADPEKAFKVSEKLRSEGVEIVTVAIHTQKTPININPQYRALSSSSSAFHSFDFKSLPTSSIDVLLNLCELNACPKDYTKHCTPKKQDVFMVVDSSRSVGLNIYPRLRRFIRRLLNKLDVSDERTQVGILQASDRRRTGYEMKLGEFTNPKVIQNVINEMSYHEGYYSYIGKGLDMAIRDNLFNASGEANANSLTNNNDRSDAENVLMIYSDGVFHDEHLVMKNVEILKRLGVRIVIVGLGRDSRKPIAKSMLQQMASTRSDVYLVELDKPSLMVENELNEVAQHVTTLQCKDIYAPPVQCSPESLDLLVVIDGSRSVGYENFGKVQIFLKKLSDEFLIGKDNAHFGVLQYGNKIESRIEFNLDKYYSNKEVKKAIANMTFLNSAKTDTGHALSVVNDEIFNGKGVDRAGVPNILILFTDGLAHDFQLARTVSKELKRKGTRIVAIGAGRKAGEVFRQIKELASSKQDAHKSNFNELSGIVDDLLDVVCS